MDYQERKKLMNDDRKKALEMLDDAIDKCNEQRIVFLKDPSKVSDTTPVSFIRHRALSLFGQALDKSEGKK